MLHTFPPSQYLLNSVVQGTCLYRSARVTGSHNLKVLRCRIPFAVGGMQALLCETNSLHRDKPIFWMPFVTLRRFTSFCRLLSTTLVQVLEITRFVGWRTAAPYLHCHSRLRPIESWFSINNIGRPACTHHVEPFAMSSVGARFGPRKGSL
jgi:hypothetical protein